MTEDKLTHAERVRLEAFSQSANVTAYIDNTKPDGQGNRRPTLEDVIANAERIEAWLLSAGVKVN